MYDLQDSVRVGVPARRLAASAVLELITGQRNGFRLTSDSSDRRPLRFGEHVLGIAVYHESPPDRFDVGATRATAGADDAELAHSRRIVPPEVECVARGQNFLDPAYFADVPPLPLAVTHMRQSHPQG